ncbi:MAG: Stk1 family PASTA domain-containing Ser/Thr kinase [Clostridia bacterium]|nr:Stk1 family PASTA domain-containing Ser/Thr kinase [Clostridia bacterium]
MDMIGKILGNRYEIIENIGTGGMATVYKARDRILNRYIAVKVLKDEFSNDSEFIKRFQVEAQSAASLSHQNIVSVYDVGNDNGKHYIVMELIEGKTLKEIITESGKIPWQDAVKIAAQIASGLNQAHKNHIIHRDIKPHNIIITKDGVAKVTDFGIAKAVSNSTINAFGSTIGSVHYFSPEHARGGYTDEKSDIYSLGVVLYEMVTGKLPFEDETPVAVALKHLHDEPEEPIHITPEIPKALNDVILKAMQKEVGNRYASAQAMYIDLNTILRNPDDITLKDVNNRSGEFQTQRIPIVGEMNTKEEYKKTEAKKKNKEQDVDDMSKSKKVTKSKALVRLFAFLLLAAVVFLVCVQAGKAVSTMILGTGSTVEVPSIVGYSEEEARKLLEANGLKMEVQANVTSDEFPVAGFVVYQEYAEGYRLKSGATVGVRLSKGANKVMVPDVSILNSTTAAKLRIESFGLVYKEEFEYHETVESGEIIRQDPKGDTEVDIGSEVTVYISMGSASGDSGLVKVPSVLGKSETEARKLLDDSKLIANVTYVAKAGEADGVVISQAPEEDSYQPELTEIVLVVNRLANGTTSGESNSGNDNANNPTGNESNNSGTPNGEPTAKRQVVIDLSNAGKKDGFNVKVVLESNTLGKKIEYEATHSRSDGRIEVDVPDIKGAMLKVYIDDEVVSEMML